MRLLLLCLIILIWPLSGNAKGFYFIRDDEIENYLKEVSTPIFKHAGLSPNGVNLYIINDPSINAFVTGGQNIFFHTGLILKATDYAMLAGVIAHETGHIYGGHLIRQSDAIASAQTTTILGYVLGAGALLAGAPELGQAVLVGTNHAAQRDFLSYTRSQEESADQAAISLMEKSKYPLEGYLRMMEVLQFETRRYTQDADPYALTHPVGSERVKHIQAEVNTESHVVYPMNKELEARHNRVRAKLIGFLKPYQEVMRLYPIEDKSIPARYARAVAFHRNADLMSAIKEMDALIAEHPNDPFIIELKAQILFENGEVEESLSYYRKAASLYSEGTGIRIGLATAILALPDEDSMEAISPLKHLLTLEPDNSFAWRQLGVAYGRAGKLDQSYLALSESALRNKEWKEGLQYLALAKEHADGDEEVLARIKEIQRYISEGKKKEKD